MINDLPIAFVVDDAAFNRKFLAMMLNTIGVTSVESENGQEALDKLNEVVPDIMFLDIMMPVLDGFQVLSAVKQMGYTFPVVIITADCQETTRATCFELGASEFLLKPVKCEQVIEMIETFIKLKVKIEV